METPQPDKTGMHILLKLASLVVILAGIHAAADIIVQLLLAPGWRGDYAVDGENRRLTGGGRVFAGVPGIGCSGGKSGSAAKSGGGAGNLHRIYGFIATFKPPIRLMPLGNNKRVPTNAQLNSVSAKAAPSQPLAS